MAFAVDGHAIEFEIRGEGKPLFVLHGLTGDRRMLVEACEPVLARAVGLKRIYLDLPGHGASTANNAIASADAFVEAIYTFMTAMAPGVRPLVLGYAYGGYLAQGLTPAIDVAAMMLVCPVIEPDFAKRTLPRRRVARREEGLDFAGDVHLADTFNEVAVVQTPTVLDAYRRTILPASLVTNRALIDLVRLRYVLSRPYMAALGRVDGPVAVLCGRDDHWVGFEDALRVVRACARSSYQVLEGCGQLLPIEEPARFHRAVEDWIVRAGFLLAPMSSA